MLVFVEGGVQPRSLRLWTNLENSHSPWPTRDIFPACDVIVASNIAVNFFLALQGAKSIAVHCARDLRGHIPYC